jgi:tetratricopeptide (TPR) repeat protein
MKIVIYGVASSDTNIDDINYWITHHHQADYLLIGTNCSNINPDTINICPYLNIYKLNSSQIDKNKNTLLNLIPSEYDIAISCDINERLCNNWRELVEKAWIPDTTQIKHKYQFFNNKTVYISRCHLINNYQWHRLTFEQISNQKIEQIAICDELIITEINSKVTFDNLDYLISQSIVNNPNDSDLLWHKAWLKAKQSNWWESIDLHKKYIEKSNNELFRSDSMIALSGLILLERYQWLLRSAAETPYRREPWFELAKFHFDKEEWCLAYGFAARALSINYAMHHITDNTNLWKSAWLEDIAAISLWNLGKFSAALIYAKKAVEITPDDIRLRNNVASIESMLL